jgi:hypothetical protein
MLLEVAPDNEQTTMKLTSSPLRRASKCMLQAFEFWGPVYPGSSLADLCRDPYAPTAKCKHVGTNLNDYDCHPCSCVDIEYRSAGLELLPQKNNLGPLLSGEEKLFFVAQTVFLGLGWAVHPHNIWGAAFVMSKLNLGCHRD